MATTLGAPKKITATPPRQRTNARIPTGQELYRQPKKPRVQEFPGDPPPEFLAGQLHGSRSEWPIYAASWKALGVKPNDGYRRGPFTGAPDGSFQYQAWQLGGRTTIGGAVVDFYYPQLGLGVRVQSYRFHLTAGPQILSADELQKQRLMRDHNVIDVYEDDFLNLRGSELVIWMKSVLGMIQSPNPVTAGQVRPMR